MFKEYIEKLMRERNFCLERVSYLGALQGVLGVLNIPQAMLMIVTDTYSKDNIYELYESIDTLCNGNDGYGFGTGVIYFFWDVETKEILYIGKAINALSRFGNHNTDDGKGNKGRKFEKIEEFLKGNTEIGFSIFVQSKFEQAEQSNNRGSNFIFREKEVAHKYLFLVESALIHAFKRRYNKLPKWNISEGILDGSGDEMMNAYEAILDVVNRKNITNLFLSKSTIRELSLNSTSELFENFILAQPRILCSGLGLYNIELTDEVIDSIIPYTDEFNCKNGFLVYIKKVPFLQKF